MNKEPDSGESTRPATDVRMRGFVHRATVEAALRWIDERCLPIHGTSLPAIDSANRILAEDIVSPVNVPCFKRSMMDGYAVRAADVAGSTTYSRQPLQVIGHAMPGQECDAAVEPGQAVRIMTGAPMPRGADSVLPVELSESDDEKLVSDAGGVNLPTVVYAIDEVAPLKNVGQVGEDIAEGETVFQSGRRLRPQDVGLLASIGVAKVQVMERPRVKLIVTGNELLPPGSTPSGFQIVDSNSPMIAALVERDGGRLEYPGILPDDPEVIREALGQPSDVILVSGGSSVGVEDHAPQLVSEMGELAMHGIAMRPSSPTGIGKIGNAIVVLLPGNPVSCLCAYDFFAGRIIRQLAGRRRQWPYQVRRFKLARKISSQVGRLDYARVQIVEDRAEPLAISGASMLSSTTRADGFTVVPADLEGYAPDTEVDVYLYDSVVAP